MKQTFIFITTLLLIASVSSVTELGTIILPSAWSDTGSISSYAIQEISSGVLVAGQYSGTVNFFGTNKTAISNDIFIIKFSSFALNIAEWIITFSGTNDSAFYVGDLAIDSSNNIYLAGSIDGEGYFGEYNVSTTSLTALVVKMNSTGGVLWARTYGSSALPEYIDDLSVDSSGNFAVGVRVQGSSVDWEGNSYTLNGGYDFLVAKFNSNGDIQWTQILGGSQDEKGSVNLDSSGYVVAIMTTYSPWIEVNGQNYTSNGASDMFSVKFDYLSGNIQWQHHYGSSDMDLGGGIDTDPSGNIFIAGTFSQTIDFGVGLMTAVSYNDAFLLRLNSDGWPIWQAQFGDVRDTGDSIRVTTDGAVYVGGTYQGTPSGLLTSDSIGAFFAKYDASSGVLSWAVGFPKESFDVSGVRIAPAATLPDGGYLTVPYIYNISDINGNNLGYHSNAENTLVATVGTFPSPTPSPTATPTPSLSPSSSSSPGVSNKYDISVENVTLINDTFIMATAADSQGNLYVGGSTIVTNKLFLSKYSINPMVLLWSKLLGDSVTIEALAVDSQDNIVAGGYVQQSGYVDFGGGLHNATDGMDFFVVKFNRNGTFLWDDFGSAYTQCTGVCIGQNDTVNVLGTYSFDGLPPYNWMNRRYASNGTLLWTTTNEAYGSGGNMYSCVEVEGSLYVVADPGATMLKINTFDGGWDWNNDYAEPGDASLRWTGLSFDGTLVAVGSCAYLYLEVDAYGNGEQDLCFLGYDTDGNILWFQMIGSSGLEYVESATLGPNNTIIVVGSYLAFSPETAFLGGEYLNGSGFFVAMYTMKGAYLWSDTSASTGFFAAPAVTYLNNSHTFYMAAGSASNTTIGDTFYPLEWATGILVQYGYDKKIQPGSSSDGGSSISTWLIIVIAVVGAALVAGGIILAVFIKHKKKNNEWGSNDYDL